MRKIKINKIVIDEVAVTPCFNCNEDEGEVRDATVNSGSTLYHVYCFNCGCTGPGVKTEEEAIKGWNVLYSYCNEEVGVSVFNDGPDFDIEAPGIEYHKYI